MLDSETWLSAQDAFDNGFCDEIEEEKQVAASLSGDFLSINGVNMDLKRFKNAPKLIFLPKTLNQKSDVPIENEDKEQPEDKVNIALIKSKLALECEL